jgi:outer membrane lipoprotein SlyB
MFHSMKKLLAGVAALAALALGGSAIAGAATSSTSTTTPQGASAPQRPPAFNGPAHGTAAHEDAEKSVTGDAAAKAQAAAVKSVGSGTAGAVTADITGKGFETTVTKSDGSKVEVHLDSSYNVMQGPGGQGGPGAHGGPGAGGGPPPAGPGA